MPSDVFVNIARHVPDDRSAEANNRRAKVVLSHVAWLLMQKGVDEIGSMTFGEEGYQQRFATPAKIPITVSVTPTEPVQVRVKVFTQPPSQYRVDAVGDDGKTIDVSSLSARISNGVVGLATALRVDKPKEPVPNQGVVVRRAPPPASAEQGKQGAEEKPIAMPQLVGVITAIWFRASKMRETDPKAELLRVMDMLQKAVTAAKSGDRSAMIADLSRAADEVKNKPHTDGIRRDIESAIEMSRSTSDARNMKTSKEDEKETAVDRLRAITKPESAMLNRGVGATQFIQPRNRTPFRRTGDAAFEMLRRSGGRRVQVSRP